MNLVSGSNNILKQNLDQLPKDLKNPFKHIRNWIKNEVMNLRAL